MVKCRHGKVKSGPRKGRCRKHKVGRKGHKGGKRCGKKTCKNGFRKHSCKCRKRAK